MTAAPAGARREAALVAAALAVVYLLTLTGNHGEAEDAVNYASGIRDGLTGQALHPHHLLWGALGWLVHNAALALGRDGEGTLGELQAMNAVLAAAGVGFLWWWLRSVGFRRIAVVLACGVLAFSYGYWFYAGEAEVYVLAAALLVGCLAAAHRAAVQPSVRAFAVLGAVNALAVLAHDTNVLFAAVALTALVVSRGDAPRAELVRRGAAYALVAVAVTVPAYAAAAAANGHTTPGQAYDWISGYAENDEWGKLEPGSVPKAAAGAGRALIGGHTAFATGATRDAAERLGNRNPREELFLMRDYPAGLAVAVMVLSLAVLLMLGAAVLRLVRARRELGEPRRRLALLCLAWLGVYAAFFTWWEPINVEFWIAAWVPASILLALPLADRAVRRETGLVAALVGGLAIANLAGSIIPAQDEADDYWRVRGQWYSDNATSRDLVITNNYVQKGYVAYFASPSVLDGGQTYTAQIRRLLANWPGPRVIASSEAFYPDADRFSTCAGGGQSCEDAEVYRREFRAGARVIDGGPLERVYLLRRPPGRGAP